VTADELLTLFELAADAQAAALAPLTGAERRARTDRHGQYALDLIADEAVVPLLVSSECAVLSEESGLTGPPDTPITIVLDPVDGSTNCARGIPYWSISLCAVDADGPWCALVANPATGERFAAVRGKGAWCGKRAVAPSTATCVEDGVIAIAGWPARALPWKQFRALGSAALTLCDVADGRIDGYLDALSDMHAPWDYLGGLLVCREAGAAVVDAFDRPLVTTEANARRTILAAGTSEMVDALRAGLAA
jgi:fructose-1,6-bisphosphatase/inositol monophosphatase family enzyme